PPRARYSFLPPPTLAKPRENRLRLACAPFAWNGPSRPETRPLDGEGEKGGKSRARLRLLQRVPRPVGGGQGRTSLRRAATAQPLYSPPHQGRRRSDEGR